MIRINLLSTKRKKKQYQVYTFLIQAGVILGLTVLVVGFLTVHFIGKVSDLKDEKAKKEKRLEDLKAKIKEVENYEKDNESYKEKTQVIEQLKKNQQAPLRLLDEVSAQLPSGIWLTALTEKSGMVNISGYTFSNADLVNYVQNLKSSKYLMDVSLLESKQVEVGGASLYQFKLTLRVKV